jgi:citrate synthase
MITEKVLEGMFKPVQSPWKTSITKIEPNKLTYSILPYQFSF